MLPCCFTILKGGIGRREPANGSQILGEPCDRRRQLGYRGRESPTQEKVAIHGGSRYLRVSPHTTCIPYECPKWVLAV